MPAKHTARPLGPARVFLSAAAAVLVLLVVWIAVRAVGPAEAARQPTVVLPSMPRVPISPSVAPVPPSVSAAPSTVRSSASRSPSPSLSPTPSRRSAQPRRSPAFSATVRVGSGWGQGYVASVRVRNTGSVAASWTITVSHDDRGNPRLVGTWGANGTQAGDNVVFTGGPLAPGATTTFGYQIGKNGRGDLRPAGCTVVGGRCGVS